MAIPVIAFPQVGTIYIYIYVYGQLQVSEYALYTKLHVIPGGSVN